MTPRLTARHPFARIALLLLIVVLAGSGCARMGKMFKKDANNEGQPVETEKGDGVLITTSMDKVFAYLDDTANSDGFLKAAQYQRMTK